MSRKFNPKKQDFANLEVVTADKVWRKDSSGKLVLNTKKYNIFGKVDKSSDCFITNTNLSGKNHKFVENTSALHKKTQNEIVNCFFNKKKRVVYLIKNEPKVGKK